MPSITRPILETEIQSIFSGAAPLPELQGAGISEADFRSASADFETERHDGFVGETILITFASKVAYDIWKKLILPRLEKKYGGVPFVRQDEYQPK